MSSCDDYRPCKQCGALADGSFCSVSCELDFVADRDAADAARDRRNLARTPMPCERPTLTDDEVEELCQWLEGAPESLITRVLAVVSEPSGDVTPRTRTLGGEPMIPTLREAIETLRDRWEIARADLDNRVRGGDYAAASHELTCRGIVRDLTAILLTHPDAPEPVTTS